MYSIFAAFKFLIKLDQVGQSRFGLFSNKPIFLAQVLFGKSAFSFVAIIIYYLDYLHLKSVRCKTKNIISSDVH